MTLDANLTHSPADVIRQLLIDGGMGTDPDLVPTQDWPVYAAGEPSNPDDCLTVKDTAGFDDGRTMTDGELQAHYGLQVRVRATSAAVGYAKASAVRKYLSESVALRAVTVGGVLYRVFCVAKVGQVLPLGKDSPNTKRSLFTLNCTAPIRQV